MKPRPQWPRRSARHPAWPGAAGPGHPPHAPEAEGLRAAAGELSGSRWPSSVGCCTRPGPSPQREAATACGPGASVRTSRARPQRLGARTGGLGCSGRGRRRPPEGVRRRRQPVSGEAPRGVHVLRRQTPRRLVPSLPHWCERQQQKQHFPRRPRPMPVSPSPGVRGKPE